MRGLFRWVVRWFGPRAARLRSERRRRALVWAGQAIARLARGLAKKD